MDFASGPSEYGTTAVLAAEALASIPVAKYPARSLGPWGEKPVLCMDGGGVKGFGSLLILQRLMDKVEKIELAQPDPHYSSYDYEGRKKEGPESKGIGYLPCHYFDYMFGTSTGGLNALMLGRLRMSVEECVREYPTMAGKIFGQPRWYTLGGKGIGYKHDHIHLEKAINAIVNARIPKQPKYNTRQNFVQLRIPEDFCRVTVITQRMRANGLADTSFLLRSYPFPVSDPAKSGMPSEIVNRGPASSFSITQVARATSAAPPYLKPIKIEEDKYLDGGIGDNNPVSWALTDVREVEKFNQGLNDSAPTIKTIVSIGTGFKRWRKTDRFLFHVSRRNLDFLKFRVTETTTADHISRKFMEVLDRPFFRFGGGEQLGLLPLDEWKPSKKKMLSSKEKNGTEDCIREWIEEFITVQVESDLERCAEILVRHRRDRQKADIDRWKRFTYCVRYGCPFKCGEIKENYLDMKRHIREEHIGLEDSTDASIQEYLRSGEIYPEFDGGPL